MGNVWEGRSSSGRRVAVKEPLINNDHDQVKIDRLAIEAEVLRTLNDEQASASVTGPIRKHVVRYVDRLRDLSHPLLITEFLVGETAANIFSRKPLSETVAMRQTLTLLDTIDAIHFAGVVHRDISPSNIILEGERGMVLIDFGASIMLRRGRSGEVERVVFKRGFSAPELLEKRSDFRSDVFSAGATLFYFLTGRNPADFTRSSNRMDNFQAELGRRVSRAASEIVQMSMSSDPVNRFQTAAAMAKAIDAVVKDKPAPILVISGQLYELKPGIVDIGRAHACRADCISQGYTKPLQVRIIDNQNFIEKHHARIWIDQSGGCSIEDLKSVNRTAIKHGKVPFKILSPSVRETLKDGDIIALAYSPKRGPYLTFGFDQGIMTSTKPK